MRRHEPPRPYRLPTSRSGRRRKETRCLHGLKIAPVGPSWGRRAAAVSVGVCSNTPRQEAGSRHGGLVAWCVRTSSRCRANPRTGIFGGWISNAERAAAHHSRGQSAAGLGFAAAERLASPPRGPSCCVFLCRKTVPRRIRAETHQPARLPWSAGSALHHCSARGQTGQQRLGSPRGQTYGGARCGR